MIDTPTIQTMRDVQSASDHRNLVVHQAGIKSLKHPLSLSTRSGLAQPTVATVDMSVSLPAEQKGTHMSRFVEILGEWQHTPMTANGFFLLLQEVQKRLASPNAYITLSAPYFRKKSAPISGVKSMMDYQCTLKGSIESNQSRIVLEVQVPVKSLCPCSRDISDFGAHNQRSIVTVAVHLQYNQALWIDDLIEMVESQASCALYAVLKRPDEKYVTERAYQNPKFVEDMVRDVANALLKTPAAGAFSVHSENFESIHNHSAFAVIEGKKEQRLFVLAD